MENTNLLTVIVTLVVLETSHAQLCKSAGNRTEDTQEPSKDLKKPTQQLPRTAAVEPIDLEQVLTEFKCNCFPRNDPNPFSTIENSATETCPARTVLYDIGNYGWGCWVDWRFRQYSCPWTQCSPYGKCNYVYPDIKGTSAYCAHNDWKQVSFYLICWDNGHWKYELKSIWLPTCCSCKVYC